MTSLVSSRNSATLALSQGQTFEGTYEPILEYSQLSVLAILGAGQRATLTVYFSPDSTGTNAISKSTIVGRNDSYEHIFEIVSRYYKLTLSADLGTVATGSLHTIHHLYKTKPVSNFLNEKISDSHSCEIQRSVLTGSTFGQEYRNVSVDGYGPNASSLMMSIVNPLTAFGELKVADSTPIVQASATYNSINPQHFVTYAHDPSQNPSTSVYCEDTNLTVRASSNEGAYATLKTRKQCIYRIGQGLSIRFAGLFPEGGQDNTLQLCGFGNRGNGLYFGYYNNSFGCLLRTRGREPIYKLVITTAATSSGNLTITLAGIAYTVPVTNANGDASYTANEIASFQFLTNGNRQWTAEAIGSTVMFTYFKCAEITGLNSFSASTTGVVVQDDTVTVLMSGTNITDMFFPQDEWNVDKMDGTGPSGANADFTKGNVYSIQMQWLGYGRIAFGMEDGAGRIVPVHHLIYANYYQVPSLELPHGAITAIAETVGANVTIQPTCKVSSVSASVEGQIVRQPPIYSTTSTKTLSGSTETNIAALKVRSCYNLFSTIAELYIMAMSFAVDAGNTAVTFRIYLNPIISPSRTTTDYPCFEYVDEAYSIALVDTTSQTVSGGTLIYQVTVAKDSSFQVTDSVLQNIYIGKDDTIVITAKGDDNTVTISSAWYEQK